MALPVKEFKFGKVSAAAFEGEYQGKKTYSFKFQKSYKKDGEWKRTDYFTSVDLRDVYILIGRILNNQVREIVPQAKKSEPEYIPPDPSDDDAPESDGEPDLPF